MKLKIKNLFLPALVILSGFLVSQCKKDSAGVSNITVKLKDATASFDHVYIEVTGVDIHSDQTGWIHLPVQDSVYDLLTLQNNSSVVLGTQQFPAGMISQVRLILGSKDSLVVSGVSYPLSLSSEDESGLKLNLHQVAAAGVNYILLLDFVVDQSVIQNGNGTYKLKPVITASFQ